MPVHPRKIVFEIPFIISLDQIGVLILAKLANVYPQILQSITYNSISSNDKQGTMTSHSLEHVNYTISTEALVDTYTINQDSSDEDLFHS